MGKLTLMAVFAHPDDEAFGLGGTLARYAAEGCDVHLVTATRGEAGQIAPGARATPANLPDIRERELRCACQVYGIHPPHLLNYNDGQLAIVHQGQAVGKLVRLIRELCPQVLVTFGPEGIYGHYDHIAIHRWATIALRLAADPDCFPDSSDPDAPSPCEPHAIDKLYYHVIPEDTIPQISPEARHPGVMMDGVPFPFVGYPRTQITTVIDVSPYGETKLRGLRCHATQIATDSDWAQEAVLANEMFQRETFILAHTTVGHPEGQETDLFRGLRDEPERRGA